MGKEAEKHQETFLCKTCVILEDFYNSKGSKIGDDDDNSDDNESINNKEKENTPNKSVTLTTSQRITTLKLNLNALSQTSWLHDSHIDLAFEDIQKHERSNGEKTLYFGPSISHFIKLAPQEEMEAQLSQNNAIYKRHIVFVVNDCKGDLGSGDGSHWSLLVFARDKYLVPHGLGKEHQYTSC